MTPGSSLKTLCGVGSVILWSVGACGPGFTTDEGDDDSMNAGEGGMESEGGSTSNGGASGDSGGKGGSSGKGAGGSSGTSSGQGGTDSTGGTDATGGDSGNGGTDARGGTDGMGGSGMNGGSSNNGGTAGGGTTGMGGSLVGGVGGMLQGGTGGKGGASSGGTGMMGGTAGNVGTAGAGMGDPCANPRLPAEPGHSGNFNTPDAVCYLVTESFNVWRCNNIGARTITVNGTSVQCDASYATWPLPPPINGGYYFLFGPGVSFTSFDWWTQ
jgi:hypothetical protein